MAKKPASQKNTAQKNTAQDSASEASASEHTDIDPRLLEILICPKTRGPLRYDRKTHELISAKAKLAYPVRQGVPIMLVDEARPL